MSKIKLTITALLTSGLLILKIDVAKAESLIKIDGSSTVYPITEAIAEDFQASRKGAVKVAVGISGTGGGFKKFCRGETDISNASRPITKIEMDACRQAGISYIELPIAYDVLTVVVNSSNPIKSLTVEQLKKIWAPEAQGRIRTWKDFDASFPEIELKLYGPGSESGTFDYFTEAIIGKPKSSRGDYVASEDDNVLVQGVSRDKGGLGYFGYAYYAENSQKLKAVGIVAKQGAPAVLPSETTVKDGTYQPLSRPIFIYVNARAIERPEVKDFVGYYLGNAAKISREVKYAPLPEKAYRMAREHAGRKKLGTVFAGNPAVGVKIEDLLAREARQ